MTDSLFEAVALCSKELMYLMFSCRRYFKLWHKRSRKHHHIGW